MEGPSLVILREAVKSFRHKKIVKAAGTTVAVEPDELRGQTIQDFKTYGKHFLIVFKKFTLRIHFLMFGSYRINERKLANPRLSLQFVRGEINFYSCAITRLKEDLETVYDWSTDIMSDDWDAIKARKKIKKNLKATVSDVLLDQNIFAGVGNIIKNEVLFRIKVHPETEVGAMPGRKLSQLIEEARNYSFDFYQWKKIYELKKHWLIYTKKKCPDCKGAVAKKYTGASKRRSFYCENCQKLFR